MEQNELDICTIRKYKIHISYQDIIIQKEKTKSLFQPTINMASNSSQKKRKGKKVREILIESSK